ncbi:ATP-binding cassette domain-containing protein, partial [Collinsella sp. 4_8_47FAA]|uniref:ATP-binding cassette domain-containing protein n=1 Tax=Collinsella sp. 4_8_47FAA TaxID=742722 RepID=UPI0018DCC028
MWHCNMGGRTDVTYNPAQLPCRPFLLTGRMSSMREVPVELRAISKRYGGFEAVKSVSFSLMEGELCALIGENGAGKSTLIRLITGLSEPSSGTISMFG